MGINALLLRKDHFLNFVTGSKTFIVHHRRDTAAVDNIYMSAKIERYRIVSINRSRQTGITHTCLHMPIARLHRLVCNL